MTTMTTQVRLREGVLFRELEGEAVLLETASGRYYGLDEVGTRIWRLLQEHERVEPVFSELLKEYEVGEEELRRDVLELVQKLLACRLVERVERA